MMKKKLNARLDFNYCSAKCEVFTNICEVNFL